MLLRRAVELLIVVGFELFAQVYFSMTTGRPLDLLATSDLSISLQAVVICCWNPARTLGRLAWLWVSYVSYVEEK